MVIRLLLLLRFVLQVFGDPPGGYYHPKYDYLDLDFVLNHKRLVYHYGNCLLSREPCPPQGMELKEILPEALETTCLRCTDKQKAIVIHVIRRLIAEYPDIWREISDQWDPTGENVRKFIAAFGGGSIESSTLSEIAFNLLENRFGEDDSGNELAGSLKPTTTTTTTPKPTKPKLRPKPNKVTSTIIRTSIGSTDSAQQPGMASVFIQSVTTAPAQPALGPQPSWLGDVSSRVVQAGTTFAGMVFSSFQAVLTG